jgi:hypothetical protein
MIHSSIEVIEIPIPKNLVINNIPLAASILKRISVSLSREIEPLRRLLMCNFSFDREQTYFRMSEFIAFEVEPSFSS